MTDPPRRRFGPSRRTEITYSRTFVMYLVPCALLFSAIWIGGVAWAILGLVRADGEAILGGGFISVFGFPVVAISWWNARRAVRDRKIQRRQLGR